MTESDGPERLGHLLPGGLLEVVLVEALVEDGGLVEEEEEDQQKGESQKMG